MKLRTQIFLFLFFFGLMPMLSVVALNLPLVQSKIEVAVRDYQIQSFSTEFIDLGQHIATRQEMVQFLAKVPDPSMLFGQSDESKHADVDWFINWVNRMLRGGQDVIEVRFLDLSGHNKLVLARKKVGFPLKEVKDNILPMNPIYFNTAKRLPIDLSYVGPIKVKETSAGSILTMNMSSVITQADGEKAGVVVIKINVAGLPQRFRNTQWVYNDGRYLQTPNMPAKETTAFEDYPGLKDMFQTVDKGVWHNDEHQVIWIPLFPTEQHGPIWVGRRLDPSEIETFRAELQLRVLVIIAFLIITVVVMARWLAYRMERVSEDLTNGIARVVNDERVEFDWRGPEEIRQLGQDLTQLADIHATSQEILAKRAEELEQTNQYKSQFLANMSHELRTPLNSIILLSKILGENAPGNMNDVQLKHASVIHRAGNDLLALINDILDIAKVEANKTTLVVSRVTPWQIIEPLADLFEPLCQEKGLTFDYDIDVNLPHIETDVEKLHQILRNFLSNAVKFTSEGHIKLWVEHPKGDEKVLCFSVTDSGIGIPKDKHHVIFDAFKQADGSTSRKFGGTGLGLTISQKIAKLLGGKILMTSEAGQGARFAIRLPIFFDASKIEKELVTYEKEEGMRVELADKTKPIAVEEDSVELDGQTDIFQQKTILLIDEDIRNLLMLTPKLEQWGFKVLGAGSGEEAQETLNCGEQCDLILIDIVDADSEGVDTIRWTREQQQYLSIPIVVMTQTQDEAKKSACLALGVTEIVAKPVDTKGLKQSLLLALSQV